jgi:hypothetical protein
VCRTFTYELSFESMNELPSVNGLKQAKEAASYTLINYRASLNQTDK